MPTKVSADCQAWRGRQLQERYAVIFVDAPHQEPSDRETVAQDAIYIVGGITFEGKREILGLYCLGGSQSAQAWQEVYQDLYQRGVRHILLAVMDGLSGNAQAWREVFPPADIQECGPRHMRVQTAKVRPKDRQEVAQAQRAVFKAESKAAAREKFEQLKKTWSKRYP